MTLIILSISLSFGDFSVSFSTLPSWSWLPPYTFFSLARERSRFDIVLESISILNGLVK